MTRTERIVAALRPSGYCAPTRAGVDAFCPRHPFGNADGSPDLHVTITDGRITNYQCDAGCEPYLVRVTLESRAGLRKPDDFHDDPIRHAPPLRDDGTPLALVAGRRNDTLFRLACADRRYGLSAACILERLAVANRRHCTPPLDEGELRRIATNAARYTPATPPGGSTA